MTLSAEIKPDKTGLPAPRLAGPADNQALIALTAACPMEGDVGLCVDRSPDFFALNRMEGQDFRLAVTDAPDGTLAGCMAGAERLAYVNGETCKVMYVSDLKVHPSFRGSGGGPVSGPGGGAGAADAMSEFLREYCRERGGDDVLTVMTVLGGNASMAKRAGGPRGLPYLSRFASIRAHNISLLWKRRMPATPGLTGVKIVRATAADAQEMADLWQRVAPRRQFAPVFTAQGFSEWVEKAPGLSWSDYRLARDREGRLLGFLAFWDQDVFKQMRVVRYSTGLKAFRFFFNLAAPALGATPLPRAGKQLRYLTAVNLCVPGDRADILRSLVISSYNESRGRGYAFLTVGLDRRDPLSAALDGLMAQPTDIDALVSTPAGRYQGPALDVLPLHFEIALV